VAKRRRVNNLLALAVLSAVLQRPMHPYEMASVLRERSKEDQMEIKWGSLYTVVQNLEKHGLLETIGSSRQGGRPERTTYRITDDGRAELEDWVRELICTPEPEYVRFEAGLSVLGVLTPEEAILLLEQRLALIEAELGRQRASLETYRREVPRLFLVEVEYDMAMREAEAAWVRTLVAELNDDSLPGMAQWRAWHATGEIPTDLAVLAERGTDPD
jgi:DNA-binding PadR family transcriptional regulator